ncbi:MAG: FAD-dependent monooxygenase [Betaproteobacteria bacterium]|uniref:FAD-dependent monooxygenase n=1 Tax=unclassified Thiomonas TaxID=2625466 RepID=UPI000BC5C7A7|nr:MULTISPECIES: FAD-dependent monooxygenase [unclassified Thiomonas]MDE2175956.1 FAD-dependent monooxygenase [Betaproteobacteria bacterium]OYV30224.1 MAG: ubiquinone biosynthesis protein [Thiomonas sp. 20-64-9]OZB70103.1 MAG: ubiquinone biosynthesis protein [Thiomonas sp. 13-64-67]
MSSPSSDLLICGGGIAGKACALALAQIGLQVTLLGARPAAALPTQGYAQRLYALNAASRQLLEELRVWPQMPPERIQPVQAMHIRADGAQLAFDARDARSEALAWIVESDAIETALDLALRFERRVVIDSAQAARLQRQPAAAGWQVQTDDGRTLQAALLIGADGEHSLVRKVSGIAMDTHDYLQRGVVANFICAAPHEGLAFQTFADNGVIALLPLAPMQGRPMVSLVWSAPEVLAQELLALPPQALAQRVEAHLPALRAQHLGPLQATGPAAAWRLQRQLARRTVADGLVLIGDAAHRVHPLAGQGLNLGLQDVQVLARTLQQRSAGQAVHDPRLLRRYSRARAEQVLALATTTDALARLYAAGSRVPGPLRALGLQTANALPPVRQLLTRYASGLPYLA